MAKMSAGSRSFLRFRNYAKPLGDTRGVWQYSKKFVMDFMQRQNINDRAVFFAENVQIMTKDEILETVDRLAKKLTEIGSNGVIEIHPSADGTSKSAHIHFWGVLNEEVEETIVNFIKENRLSNKPYLNYTNPKFEVGKSHKIENNEIIEREFVEDEKKEVAREKYDEIQIAKKNDFQKLDNNLSYYRDTIDEWKLMIESFFGKQEEVNDIDIEEDKEIDYSTYLFELNLKLNFEDNYAYE
jgi:hypothetical protein